VAHPVVNAHFPDGSRSNSAQADRRINYREPAPRSLPNHISSDGDEGHHTSRTIPRLLHREFDRLLNELTFPSVDHQRPAPRLNRFRHFELNGSRGLLHHLTFEIVDTVGQVQRIDICVVHFLALGADQIAHFSRIRLDGGHVLRRQGGSQVAVKMISPAAAVIGKKILMGSFLLLPGQKLYTLP